jgi:hypothetical protein
MRVFRRSRRVLLPSPPLLIAVHKNRCWNGLGCRDQNPGLHSLSARDDRASVRATIPDRKPRVVGAIASYHADSLTMGQSAQSAPAVPDDRAGRTRCSVGREKFARDFVSAISCARQTPLLAMPDAIETARAASNVGGHRPPLQLSFPAKSRNL